MSKKYIIMGSVLLILVLVVGGFYYWKSRTQKLAAQRVADISADIGNNVSPDVTTPTVNLPNTDANPYNKTNPFLNLKINPFE